MIKKITKQELTEEAYPLDQRKQACELAKKLFSSWRYRGIITDQEYRALQYTAEFTVQETTNRFNSMPKEEILKHTGMSETEFTTAMERLVARGLLPESPFRVDENEKV